MSELNPNPLINLARLRTGLLLMLVLASLAFTSTDLAAQDTVAEVLEENAELVEDVVFQDNLGRDTPRSSFLGFLLAAEKFDYEQAAKFMDFRNLPFEVGQLEHAELARQLDFVIKRGMKVNIDHLSLKVTGQVVDGLPDYRDELGRVIADDAEQIIYIQRVPGDSDNFVWKISNASVAQVPELYDFLSYPQWVEDVRENVPGDFSFLGIELFKWVIILAVAAIAYPAFWLIGLVLSWLISRPGSPLHIPVRKLFTRPLAILAVLYLTRMILLELGLGARAQVFASTKTFWTIVMVWLIFSLIDLFRAIRRERFLAQGRADAHILGRPMANSLKLITLLVASLFWMANAGINITTLLTGLGIGGLALALALQKPIEDVLGAVSIYAQQPIATGDLCKYGTALGHVEEIGLRTTRLRTLDDTLVSVPNSIIAHGAIENYSAREKILYHPDLPLRYDTTARADADHHRRHRLHGA